MAASWLSGWRRKTKGWGSRVSEGEGRAGPSQPGGQGPKGVGRRAGRPKAKAQAAGLKPEPCPIQEIKPFQNLFGIQIFGKVLKFAQGDLEGILIWGFFLKSSRLSMYFRKMKYAMSWYATLGKIN
jgi:hypothetical protein